MSAPAGAPVAPDERQLAALAQVLAGSRRYRARRVERWLGLAWVVLAAVALVAAAGWL